MIYKDEIISALPEIHFEKLRVVRNTRVANIPSPVMVVEATVEGRQYRFIFDTDALPQHIAAVVGKEVHNGRTKRQ